MMERNPYIVGSISLVYGNKDFHYIVANSFTAEAMVNENTIFLHNVISHYKYISSIWKKFNFTRSKFVQQCKYNFYYGSKLL
jgi:hypothetical protein